MPNFRAQRLRPLIAVWGFIALNASAAAQQALPTIEVGAGHRLRATPPRHSAAATTRPIPVWALPISRPVQLFCALASTANE